MRILVLNSGSSSVKFSLEDLQAGSTVLRGFAENLNTGAPRLVIEESGAESHRRELPADSGHEHAIEAILEHLQSAGDRPLSPDAIGHRVVHGGEFFREATLIDSGVLERIKSCSPLAPLHNPGNLLGIRVCRESFPDLPQVAVFDTAFHQTLPPRAFHYALPYEFYERHQVRRYGFHGTSHRYVNRTANEWCGLEPDKSRWISAHLGNGCSATAISKGRSVDTTMGLTPLEGLVMGSRSGDVDPGLHQYLSEACELSLDALTRLLNRESGLLGLSGVSNDMRTLRRAADEGNLRARLAIEVFVYRLAKTIASLLVPLGGADGLIFTGGIGENDTRTREAVCDLLAFAGFQIDPQRNDRHGKQSNGFVSPEGNIPRILVVPTNEERMIALESRDVLQSQNDS